MKQQYQKVAIPRPDSSMFDLSHEHTTSIPLGKIIPVLVKEMVPFEKITLKPEMFARFQPLVSPVMHRMDLRYEVFFVPNDIIWDDWKKFINGEKVNGLDINHPKITGSFADYENMADPYFKVGSLADYLGMPVTQFVNSSINTAPAISQLPFRAYQMIWNNYYRNQRLQDEIEVSKDSIDFVVADELDGLKELLTLRKRNWEKDYFTSCLPTAQQGDPVNLIDAENGLAVKGRPQFTDLNEVPINQQDLKTDATGWLDSGAGGTDTQINDGLAVDMAAVTIRDFRWAMALQRYLERLMLVGSRYYEKIMALFGRKPSYARLDIPEFLGGGRIPVMVSETEAPIAQTAKPQGTMTGRAYAGGVPDYLSYESEDYGWLIAIVSVMPRTKYHQGLHKQFSRFDIHDYINPMFANIGEQEVMLQEVYVNNGTNNEETFGYQERYGEYKSLSDRVSGEIRTTLKNWTMLRSWAQYPMLNDEFVSVQDAEEMFDVFAVTESNPVILQIYFDFKSILPLPSLSIPK